MVVDGLGFDTWWVMAHNSDGTRRRAEVEQRGAEDVARAVDKEAASWARGTDRAVVTVGLSASLQNKLVADVAARMDPQLFGDAGDGINRPQGIFAWAGTQVVDTNGTLTLDMLLDGDALFMDVDGLDENKATLVTTPTQFTALRKLKDTQGRYLVEPDPTSGAGYRLFGHRVLVTKHAKGTALVDFSKVVLAKDVAPSVKVLDQTFGDYDQQAIRVVHRVDAKPADPRAVVVFKDAA